MGPKLIPDFAWPSASSTPLSRRLRRLTLTCTSSDLKRGGVDMLSLPCTSQRQPHQDIKAQVNLFRRLTLRIPEILARGAAWCRVVPHRWNDGHHQTLLCSVSARRPRHTRDTIPRGSSLIQSPRAMTSCGFLIA